MSADALIVDGVSYGGIEPGCADDVGVWRGRDIEPGPSPNLSPRRGGSGKAEGASPVTCPPHTTYPLPGRGSGRAEGGGSILPSPTSLPGEGRWVGEAPASTTLPRAGKGLGRGRNTANHRHVRQMFPGVGSIQHDKSPAESCPRRSIRAHALAHRPPGAPGSAARWRFRWPPADETRTKKRAP